MELNERQRIFIMQHQRLIAQLEILYNNLPHPVLTNMIEINQAIIDLKNFLTENYPDLSQQLQRPEIVNLDNIYSSISIYSSELFEYNNDANYSERQIVHDDLILYIPERYVKKQTERIHRRNLIQNLEHARQAFLGRN